MTAFVAIMLPLTVALGLWQLERGAAKEALEQRALARLGKAPVAPPQQGVGTPHTDFMRVQIRGRYEPGHHYLVDNRLQRGRPGYWVVSRFRAIDGRVYLVNRGWLAAPPSRETLPQVGSPEGEVVVTGVLWPDLGLPPLLAADPWPLDWPRRVQRLDVARMAAQADDVAAVEVRLEPGQPGVFSAVPISADFRPERHRGYAVQWFGLALVLVVGYLVFGARRRETTSSEES